MNGNNNLVVAAVYIPDLSSSDYYKQFINNLQDSLSSFVDGINISNCIILCDFNVPRYSWVFNDKFTSAVGYHNSHNVRQAAYALSNFYQLYNLNQLNKYFNVISNILDLLFSTINNVVLTTCDDAII